jgi:hypothetical protein
VIKLDNPGLPVSSAAIIDQSELRGNGGNGYT